MYIPDGEGYMMRGREENFVYCRKKGRVSKSKQADGLYVYNWRAVNCSIKIIAAALTQIPMFCKFILGPRGNDVT